MCQSTAYSLTVDGEQIIMEDVANLKIEQGKIYLTNLLGQRKTIYGIIKEIRMIDHKILISETGIK